MQNLLKDELHNVLSGKSEVSFGTTIQPIAGYLNNGTQTGRGTENTKHFREQETKSLEEYISLNNLWVPNIDLSQYVSEGAEQKVYLNSTDQVIKLNDAIYYTSWLDYFHNLLFHNFFFPDTAYELRGFTKQDGTLYAVVAQSFVSITQHTDLNEVRLFLRSNGFENTRNNDYQNHDLGIILEDLHDENVLTRNGVLYFIDTVFYVTDQFWK